MTTEHKNNFFTEKQELNIVKWIKALRSRNYKQGKGYLLKDNKYCCLGVKCDIDKMPAELFRGRTLDPFFNLDTGIRERDAKLLAAMNDGSEFYFGLDINTTIDEVRLKKHTFPEIADFLEECLESSRIEYEVEQEWLKKEKLWTSLELASNET